VLVPLTFSNWMTVNPARREAELRHKFEALFHPHHFMTVGSTARTLRHSVLHPRNSPDYRGGVKLKSLRKLDQLHRGNPM
jgi:hypothetical protein